MDLNFNMVLREALWRPKYDKPHLNIKADSIILCKVWGCYQFTDDGYSSPVFVIELEDGHCTSAILEEIQFIEDENGHVIDYDKYAKGGVIPL